MLRTRLYDIRLSDFPKVLGICSSDVASVASAANTANRRLLYCREATEDGWYGGFAEVGFDVDPDSPYITAPRGIARLEMINVCQVPVPLHNQYFEYLLWGTGRMRRQCGRNNCITAAYMRNNAVTFVEMPTGSYIRIYVTESQDVGKRVLIQGVDTVDNILYSNDGTNRVTGQFLTLEQPFVTSSFQLSNLTGIQKDITAGDVQFFAVDSVTGDETLLLTMQPSEQTASYSRYYLNRLPRNCCNADDTTVRVTAIAKLDFIPMRVDTDYSLIQNIEALIEEGQSMRYSRIDTMAAKQMAAERHVQAVRLLNGEITHFLGELNVSVNFAPFGSAKLERINIGMV